MSEVDKLIEDRQQWINLASRGLVLPLEILIAWALAILFMPVLICEIVLIHVKRKRESR